jgi:hypothetical protein
MRDLLASRRANPRGFVVSHIPKSRRCEAAVHSINAVKNLSDFRWIILRIYWVISLDVTFSERSVTLIHWADDWAMPPSLDRFFKQRITATHRQMESLGVVQQLLELHIRNAFVAFIGT